MKIAQLIWSLGLGGAERQVGALSSALHEVGEHVEVWCFHDPGFRADEIARKGITQRMFLKRGRFDLAFPFRLAKQLRANQIEILHAHLFTANFWGAIAARLAGIPVVITIHSPEVMAIDRWQLPFMNVAARLADRTQTISRPIFEALSRYYFPHVVFLPLGVDFKRIVSIPPLADPPWPTDAEPIGIFCRLAAVKDLPTFVKAVSIVRRSHPRALGVIAGDGALRDEINRLVSSHGGAEAFMMLGRRDDAIAVMKRVKVAVLSSLREGMPLALMEAMASRVPIAATAATGVAALVTDGIDARLAPIGDAGELAKQIVLQLEQPLPTEPGFAKIRDNYALVPVLRDKTLELYREILNERRSDARIIGANR